VSDKTPEEIEIEALEAEAVAAEAAAKAAEPSPLERRRIEAMERTQAAKEQAAQSEMRKRAPVIAAKERAILKDLEPGALVKGLDLYSYFPLGAKPSPMPACGFIVVRNPDPAAAKGTHAAVEAREKSAAEIAVDLIVSTTQHPTVGEDAVAMRAFLDAFPDAALLIAGEVRALGGAKSRERPRGRG